MRPYRGCLAVACLLFGQIAVAAEPSRESLDFFEKEIRPLLVVKCQECHGPKKAKGGLRLTSRESILLGGDSGPSAVVGKPAESLLIKAVRYADEPRMPPKQKLAEREIQALARWVELGLPWPKEAAEKVEEADRPFTITDAQRRHWAYQPLRPPALPSAADSAWPVTEVDRFILAALEARQIQPSSPADRRALLRRVTFDLTGLPPTPEEAEAFVSDRSPEAFARTVERLLASPHYGERWGRHWLDVVRYADTAGETADYPAPHAWRYRNYVIASFNADKPYDQFVREQLAGDILAEAAPPERYAELVVATGYVAIARRFGFDPAADHYLTIEDTIDTVGKSILGLTLGCARCHDHKYDPIATTDYYALYGVFDSTRYPFPGSEKDKRPRDMVLMMHPADQKRTVEPVRQRLATIDAELAGLQAEQNRLTQKVQTASIDTERDIPLLDELPCRMEEMRRQRTALAGALENVAVAYGMREGTPHNARLHRRGEPTNLGPEVSRRFLQLFGDTPVTQGSGRLALADWLTRGPAAPLTARVIVNRVWQHHFGVGLVATPNDLGSRGAAPSHPELLEFLAQRFVADGWSIKKLHRRMLLSRVYQQSSTALKAPAADPENTLLWRMNRRRLSAEEIRDAILAVSGDLDRTPGGPHPFPAEKTWGFTQHNPFAAVYDHDRRSVYLMTQRIKRHPFLSLFDGADPSATTGRRDVTTVPTQALFFMNDPFVHQKAARVAERLLRLPDDSARLEYAARLCYSRPPSAEERSVAARILAGPDRKQAWAAWARVMLASNEFLYVD